MLLKKFLSLFTGLKSDHVNCSGCFTEILLIRARARGKEGDSKHEVIPHGDGVGAASLALQKAPQSAKATNPPRDAGPRLWPRHVPGEPRGSSAALRPSWRSSGARWEVSTESVRKAPRSCRRCWVIGWVGFLFRFFLFAFFVGRTAIRRKEGWHPGRERAPSPGSTGRSSPAPAGKADPAGFWPAKSWDSLFPEPIARRKSPRDGKHQTLATVMYREQHLLFTVWG